MAHITENDYKKLAEAVSHDLLTNKVAMNTSISKLASSMDMSQEQTRRLCEASNNTAFNKMFQSKDKTAADRLIDFDVADADVVLGHAIKEASAVPSAEGVVYLSEYRTLRADDDEESLTKTAFELRPDTKPKTEQDRRTVRKTLDHMRHEKIATAYMYDDALSSIKNQFKRLYRDTDFATFEKKAAAIHGPASIKPLSDLRVQMRLPAVTYDFAQLQKTAGYIDDSKIEFKLFADAVTHADKIANITQGIAKLEPLV